MNKITKNFLFSFSFASKLGTHGSPRRRNAGHDPPVKHLGLGEVKRFTGGMHNTETLPGMYSLIIRPARKNIVNISLVSFINAHQNQNISNEQI